MFCFNFMFKKVDSGLVKGYDYGEEGYDFNKENIGFNEEFG